MAKGFVRHIEDYKDMDEGYLIRDPEGETVECNIVTVKKGEKTSLGCHMDEEEYYFVYKGTGQVVLDGVKHIVGHGDFLFIPRGCTHISEGISDEDFIFICVAIYLERTPKF